MNFRLVLMLSLLGIPVAAASVMGWHGALESLVSWLGLPLAMAAVLAHRAPGKMFLHGFLAGFLCNTISNLIHVAFMGQYLLHNPKAADALKAIPLVPALLVAVSTPITASVAGVVTGLLTLIWARSTRRTVPAA